MLVKGESVAAVARATGLHRSSLSRHKDKCLRVALERARQRDELDADHLLWELGQLSKAAKLILSQCMKERSWAYASSALRECRSTIELITKLTGALRPETQVNVAVLADGDQWTALRARIMQALEAHPEARADVLSAIAGDEVAKLERGDMIDTDAEVIDVE